MKLEDLGLTQEKVQELLIDKLASQAMMGTFLDEDGNPFDDDSQFSKKMYAHVKICVDRKIEALAEQHLLPGIKDRMDTLILAETNEWGEKKGKQFTFIEYMIARAEAYLNEIVDYEGKPRTDRSSYWNGKQSRLTHMVEKYLYSRIEDAMKSAVKIVNDQLGPALAKTAQERLASISTSLKVDIATKSS